MKKQIIFKKMKTICIATIFLTYFLSTSINAYSQNKVLNLNGVSSQINIPNNAALSPAKLTVEAWINATAWRNESWRGTIIGKDSHTDQGYVLRIGNNGQLDFTIITTTGYKSVLSTNNMSAGQWYHVAGVFDGSSIKIYINGVLSGTSSTTGTLTQSTCDLLIGQSPSLWNERYFNGMIDEVRIWNVARTQQQLIDNTLSVTAPQIGLVGYWKFDNNVTDASGNNFNGLNTGALFVPATWDTAMTFESATCTRKADYTEPGTTNQEILKVKIVTKNSLNPFSLTSMNVDMNGTTKISDFSLVKVYYTGSSPVFSTNKMFGSFSPAKRTIALSGNQPLDPGDNYFWVVSDVNPKSKNNHILVAECTSLNFSGGVGLKIPIESSSNSAVTINSTQLLWNIGTADNSGAEFALAPNRYAEMLQKYAALNTVYNIGYSSPANDFPYIIPGSADTWAGSGYWAGTAPRHYYRTMFNLNKKGDGVCFFKIDYVAVNGATVLQIDINGHEQKIQLVGGTSSDPLTGGWASGVECKVNCVIPSSWLNIGLNVIKIGHVKGSWGVFDELKMRATSGYELKKAYNTLVTSVKSADYQQLKNGTKVQSLIVDMIQYDKKDTLTLFANGKSYGKVVNPGHIIEEFEIAAPTVIDTIDVAVLNSRKDTLFRSNVIRHPSKMGTYADFVDPFISTGNSRWMSNPGPRMPFGMIAPGPDTQDTGWKAGYEFTSETMIGFSHIHEWMMAGLLIMPTTGPLKITAGTEANPETGYRSHFDKATEKASPGYYGVELTDYDIKAELTATTRSAMHRYTFKDTVNAKILIDLHNKGEYNWTLYKGVIRQVSPTELEGYAISNCNSPEYSGNVDYTVNFVIQTDKPITSMDGWINSEIFQKIDSVNGGGNVGGVLYFNLKPGETVQLRTAISLVSIAQARLNLEREMKTPFNWDFDGVVDNARNVWNDLLGKIKIETTDNLSKQKFYSNLYSAYCPRNTWSDVNGKWMDMNEKVQQLSDTTKTMYGSDGYWGWHWNLVPLYNLITPEVSYNWINSFLEMYDKGGWLPIGNPGLDYVRVMLGSPQIPLMISAYQHGYTKFDTKKVFEAIKHQLTSLPEYHSGGAWVGVEDLESYLKYKYIPDGLGTISNTFEYAYQDWCFGQYAKALSNNTNYKTFDDRGKYWKNSFDASIGFARTKLTDGSWKTPFDVYKSSGFTEGNAFNYTWYVPQNPKDLITTMGYQRFVGRLDNAFVKSSVSNFNAAGDNFSAYPINQGNESGMHVSYLFNFAGQPWLTQKWARAIQEQYYGTTPLDGYLGDEDQGQMSSWYVLSSTGLFQTDGGCSVNPTYEIGSPRFPKTTFTTGTGNTFTILANNASKENCYIASARLNGKPLNTFRFPVSEFQKGGCLELEMTSDPVKVNFEADKTIVTTVDSVTFNDVSLSEPQSWNWTFEGGTPATSTEASPKVVYKQAGTYKVSLTNTNVFGGIQTLTKNAYVKVLPFY